MLIYVITEYYPSLYKPYFDTQFARFIQDGHTLRVFTLSGGDKADLEQKVVDWGLDQLTQGLPNGRGSLPRFAGTFLHNLIANPRGQIAALTSALIARPRRVARARDFFRLLALPAAAPNLCLVHNLSAAREVRFLQDLYPGVPVAFYYHGGELSGMLTVNEALARAAFSAADVVFTNTEVSKRHAVTRGCDPAKVVVSPVGFSLNEYPASDARLYRNDDRLNVLSVGRLSPEKGIGYAIESVRQLVASGERNFHYKIIGGGPLGGSLRRQVSAAGLEDYVELLGPVTRSQLIDELQKADVLVLPSIVVGTWEENQACVVQEALLMKAVVIATATGGVPESLAPEMHRYLVPEGDATAIAVRLVEVGKLSRTELAELGAAGRRFAEARYDIGPLNAQLLDCTLAYAERRPTRTGRPE